MIILVVYLQIVNTNEAFDSYRRRVRGYAELQDGSNTPWSIPEEDENKVRDIVVEILKTMNEEVNTNYYPGKFDSVNKTLDNSGNTRFIVDIFIYDVRKYVNRRVIMDFTVISGTNDVQINTINLSNAVRYDEPMTLHDEPVEKIIKDTNVDRTYRIMGNVKSTLNYSVFSNPLSKKANDSTDVHKWILPIGIQASSYNVFPCRNQGTGWDRDGIDDVEAETDYCKGINSAYGDRHLVGNYHPPHVKLLSEPNQHSWIFNKSRGITGFPVGGPGKT